MLLATLYKYPPRKNSATRMRTERENVIGPSAGPISSKETTHPRKKNGKNAESKKRSQDAKEWGQAVVVVRLPRYRYVHAKQSSNHIERDNDGSYLGDIQDHVVTMMTNLGHFEKMLSRAHSNYLAQISIESISQGTSTNRDPGYRQGRDQCPCVASPCNSRCSVW